MFWFVLAAYTNFKKVNALLFVISGLVSIVWSYIYDLDPINIEVKSWSNVTSPSTPTEYNDLMPLRSKSNNVYPPSK